MQLATATDPRSPRPAPAVYPASSKSLEAADRRCRALADAMYRLSIEGEVTDVLLMQEGFSRHEIELYRISAGRLVDQRRTRSVEAEPPLTDDELLARALDRTGGLIDTGLVVAKLRGALFTPDQIARIWPRLMVKLAAILATSPIPGAAQ